jgi:hypothetical protein
MEQITEPAASGFAHTGSGGGGYIVAQPETKTSTKRNVIIFLFIAFLLFTDSVCGLMIAAAVFVFVVYALILI